jgi:hypothetical protein
MADYRHIRRVVNGTAYNTSTSLLLKAVESEDTGSQQGDINTVLTQGLYRTRNRDYFLAQWIDVVSKKTGPLTSSDSIEPISLDAAKSWLQQHDPENFELVIWPHASAEKQRSGGTVLTVRVPVNLKTVLDIQAQKREISTNQLAINYLEFGAANRVSEPKPPVTRYVTDDAAQRRLLTDSGRPGLDAIKNNGEDLNELRTIFAELFRDHSRGMTKAMRNTLISILEDPSAGRELSAVERQQWKDQIQKDAVRWLRLLDERASASGQ